MFEDEFFRQLVGGTLNEQTAPAVETAPAPAPVRASRRADPRRRLSERLPELPRIPAMPRVPAMLDARRVGALAMGALVLVGVVAIARGSGTAGTGGTAERSQAIKPMAPAEWGGGGSGGAKRTELIVRWSGTSRGDGTGAAHRKVSWIRDGRLSITGTVRTPGGYRSDDGPISVSASEGGEDGEEAKVGELTPNKEGDFRADVALDRGAPRKVLTFAYSREGGRAPLATATAVLEVEGGLTVDVRKSRRSVVLSGRTRPGRASLSIAARAPRSAWSRQSSVQSDDRGRWRERIHLPRPAPRGRYTFRVSMGGDAEQGFLPVSRKQFVLVRR